MSQRVNLKGKFAYAVEIPEEMPIGLVGEADARETKRPKREDWQPKLGDLSEEERKNGWTCW